jgi:dihydrodipicolinate synthase/N-acetylneuraminate lyase
VTPIRSDQRVDLDDFGELIDYQVGAGIHGLFLLGTIGEGPLLDPAERREAAEYATRRNGGRVPLAIHCGAADTKTSAELAEHAVDIGADAVAAVSPFYFRYDAAALREHFTSIARAADPAPVYLYDNPERVGYSLSFSMVHELVREVENIKGVKDTGDSVARVTRYVTYSDPEVEVYTGNNLIVLPALVMGAKGSVSALASAAPELFVGLYESVLKGDYERARELQLTAAELQGTLEGLPYVGGIKHLVDRRGFSCGTTRRPLPEATEDVRRTIDARLEALGELAELWVKPNS